MASIVSVSVPIWLTLIRMLLATPRSMPYNVARDPVSVPDLHATILHLLGLDHTRLTYPYLGRNFRLTDVSGTVQTQLLA